VSSFAQTRLSMGDKLFLSRRGACARPVPPVREALFWGKELFSNSENEGLVLA
jgi:hypothetical protein